MKVMVTLDVDDYVYEFYQIGSMQLNRSVKSLMEEALFRYAGIVADGLNRSHEEERKDNSSTPPQ